MCFRTGNHHVKPSLPKRAGDDADGDVMGFKHGALFNMRFKIGTDTFGANVVLTCIADCFECFTH